MSTVQLVAATNSDIQIQHNIYIVYFCCCVFQIDKSNANDVVLNSLELSSSGTYRCEVSAEAPSFQTVFQDRDMVTMSKSNVQYHTY